MTPGPTGEPHSAGGRTVPSRAAFWRALSLWVLTLVVAATDLVYNQIHPLPAKLAVGQGNAVTVTVAVTFIVGFATVGALLAWKRPRNPIGWLLCATGLSYAFATIGRLLLQFPLTRAWGNSTGWLFFAGLGFVIFVLLLFPTGSLPSRRWRPVAWAAAAALTAWALGNSFAPMLIAAGPPPVRNPIGVAGPAGHVFTALGGAGVGLTVATGLAAIVSLVFRYRRAGTVEREQLKWLVYAGGLIVAAVLAATPIERIIGPGSDAANNLQNALSSGSVALVPIAIGIAIFRYHLYDIDVVINKTLVYGSLAVFITGVYIAIAVGAGSLVQHGARPSLALSVAATAVVAVAFQPVRGRVQRLANRLVYGHRASPYEVLAEFAGHMAGTYAAQDLLPRMARILAEGTGAARADVWLKDQDTFRDEATWPPGAPPWPAARATATGGPALAGADRILPVRYQGEVLGALSVAKRPGEALNPTEDRLLADLAAQAGLVLKNAGLREQLLARLEEIRASRQRLVAAQDDERRRIERNIHDGAQQQLVALAIKLTLAGGLIGSDTDGERELLAELRRDAAGAAEDLRDLARGIYPSLLAGAGLPAALEAQARKAPVPTVVTADGVGRYPQDVEAAVYFCVLEALQNVTKYAGARRARVRLAISGPCLEFEVADDGAGFDPGSKGYGTGLQGMADRLHAHGGSLTVRSSPGAGTTILGRLPCRVLERVP
jgi:signal transduction histidine kinase